ncbi:Suppressor of Sensor Kinase (SLN1) [Podila minutissima]|uniref:Suppressor of Sensor Kinase (SLN1) n=1 Tax=Podila minutissima TaxID=64525 RepID=A0A9P5SJL2_9FUNG|nr:Suppressor of Sensor Kinase (SLN1) [Podila minutissima]
MSSFRVQEGEDDDAIPAARPSSMKKRTTTSARNSINMNWSIRSGASTDELRSSSSPGPVTFSATQSISSSQTTSAEPVVAPRKAKGVSFFVQDDSDQDLDNDPEEDHESSQAVAETEEVMRSMPENVRMGFENLGIDDNPDQEQDPVARYFDNDGQDDEEVQETQETRETDEGADNRKDQERLDRFMQPTSNVDEGVLELNRERIDWQSMLQSVLAGDVFNTEQRRLKEPQFAIQPQVKQQIWLGIRSTLRNRAVGEEKRFVEEARNQADGFLQEVLTFKVDPNSPKSSLEQVIDVLRKVDIVESMYPTLAAVDKPVYKSPKFHKCLEALNAYASIMKKMKIQIKILRNWTGSETLEVTRYKDAAGNEVSFVDRLLKEDGLQRAFEKSTLGALHQAMTQIRETMIENAVNFARMGLVPTMSDIQLLIRFPTTLMQECLRLRLEYADRVTVPTLLIVDQMVGDFKTSLDLACKIKNDYRILEKSEDGWYLEPCIGEEFEKVLKSSLQFYFKLLSWKVEYEGQNKIYSSSVLEDEWDNLSKLGQQIDGIGLHTAEHLCFLISKSTAFVYKHLQDQIKDRPEQPQPAGEITRFYGKILEDVRSRANKLRQFSRKLTDTFENAAEYLLDKKKGDSLANLMMALAGTNHVLIYTNAIESQGIYMIVEYKVAERPNSLLDTLRSCFEQQGTGYILIFTPRERFVWSGAIMPVDGFNDIEIDIKPGRVRLISERGSNLDTCKKRFDKVSEPFGLEIITESRANVPALNKELNKAKKASYKLTDTIVQSVTVLRKATSKVPNCQDLVQPFFRFASDYGIKSLSTMEGLPRSQFNLKLLRLSIDWVSFVCDDCDQSERKTFRWAMTALTFSMNMTKGNNILALSDREFSWLRSKIAGCMTLLISHFDIHGARSQSEAMRAERDGRSKDATERMEELLNITQLAMAHEKALSPEALLSHRQQLENLAKLDTSRVEKERENGIVGKVLDDEKPEDRSLVFLAGLTDSKAIRYQMAKYVGSGTFGTVYLATNLVTGELMAVKEIRFQNASMSLFKSIRDEMKVMKMMHHPNIVQYDSIEVHRHKVLIFMEYCQGGSLADLLEHGRIEDEKVIKVYTYQMLKGLAYLHGKNVVHRDVKPDNVLLDHFGNIKFVDFGAAKILAKNQRTRTMGRAAESIAVGAANSLNGTPMYMAPEVIKNGEKGRKGSMDIWSLGCCVLEMATGRRPWAHLDNEWAVMYHVATSHPPLPEPSQMTPRGMAFLKKCFIRDSNERPSAVELLRDPWLRGVENEETRQLYEDFEENEVEILGEIVRSDLNSNGHPNADDNIAGDYDEDEIEDETEKLRVHEDHGEVESQQIIIPPFSHVEEKKPHEAIQKVDRGTTKPGDNEELDDADRDGQTSPSNGSVVSEVGSEVEMMLNALREREEGSRQPSQLNSPMPGAVPMMYGYPGDDGAEILGSESGYQGIPSLAAVVPTAAETATGTAAPGLATTSSMDPTRFGREMGIELYNSMSPDMREPRSQMSPVVAVKLMGKLVLPNEHEMLAAGHGLPREKEVSEQELSRLDRALEEALETNGDDTL